MLKQRFGCRLYGSTFGWSAYTKIVVLVHRLLMLADEAPSISVNDNTQKFHLDL